MDVINLMQQNGVRHPSPQYQTFGGHCPVVIIYTNKPAVVSAVVTSISNISNVVSRNEEQEYYFKF